MTCKLDKHHAAGCSIDDVPVPSPASAAALLPKGASGLRCDGN